MEEYSPIIAETGQNCKPMDGQTEKRTRFSDGTEIAFKNSTRGNELQFFYNRGGSAKTKQKQKGRSVHDFKIYND